MLRSPLVILAFVCVALSIFPPPIRADVDSGLARMAIASALAAFIHALIEFGIGFYTGWKRSASPRGEE